MVEVGSSNLPSPTRYKKSPANAGLFVICFRQMRTESSSRAQRDNIGAYDDSPQGDNLPGPTNIVYKKQTVMPFLLLEKRDKARIKL